MNEAGGAVLDWLVASVDPSRGHEIGAVQYWHARFMTLAWGICAPLGILIARYLKVTPRQNWPQELDNPFWWRCHLILQGTAAAATGIGLLLILTRTGGLAGFATHHALGWIVVVGIAAQVLSGVFRGTKGGPTAPAPDGSLYGDHYSMTRRRHIFEAMHKAAGYGLLLLGAAAVVQGLWLVNAPRWMGLAVLGYWGLLLVGLLVLRRRPRVTTYQAIWGPDPTLPGNRE